MPVVTCSCGQRFEAPPGETACPGCGSIHRVAAEERIRAACSCGAMIAAPLRLAGNLVKCPKCAQPVRVPAAREAPADAEPVDLLPVPAPSAPKAASRPSLAARPAAKPAPPPPAKAEGWRMYGRWALAAALLPLIFSSFSKEEEVEKRLEKMIEHDPDLAAKIQKLESRHGTSEEDLFEILPDHRIEGAHLARSTMTHWVYALLSAAAFWGFILLVYPMGNSTSKQLWSVGLFTGTIGIFLLLALQWTAAVTRGGWSLHGGKLAIILLLIKLIGFSYSAALDPSNGFILSMVGFTFGVGLCEEFCKALPLFWHYKHKATLDLRGAVVWGLASGIGFGVSEGITYSSDYYNGITTGGIYVVRFVSCVALHAVWSAASAILLWRRQADLEGIENWYDWFIPIFKILGISMALHALYDTALKRDVEPVSIVAAIASFAWFFWLYERARRQEAQFVSGAIA